MNIYLSKLETKSQIQTLNISIKYIFQYRQIRLEYYIRNLY